MGTRSTIVTRLSCRKLFKRLPRHERHGTQSLEQCTYQRLPAKNAPSPRKTTSLSVSARTGRVSGCIARETASSYNEDRGVGLWNCFAAAAPAPLYCGAVACSGRGRETAA